MEHHCLSRNDYQSLIHQLITENRREGDLEGCLTTVLERAKNYWDINVVGVNYFLSIIIEQVMKKSNIDKEFIARVYNLKNEMYFTIDELDHKFINELFINNLPEARNCYTVLLDEARKSKNQKLISELEKLKSESFEEDLIRIIEKYYEEEIYH